MAPAVPLPFLFGDSHQGMLCTACPWCPAAPAVHGGSLGQGGANATQWGRVRTRHSRGRPETAELLNLLLELAVIDTSLGIDGKIIEKEVSLHYSAYRWLKKAQF